MSRMLSAPPRPSGQRPLPGRPVVALEASADALSDLIDAGEVPAGAPVFTWT